MAVRTFFWNPKPRGRVFNRRGEFAVGNAGDLFNRSLIEWAYPGEAVENTDEVGRRLLLVGSIAHRARDGDVVCGVGTKGLAVSSSREASLTVFGVRGPKSYEAFAGAGHDMSRVRFLGDPGLLVGKVFPQLGEIRAIRNRVIYIPHFLDRVNTGACDGVEVVSIDASPLAVATQIAQAEAVYTSSLHALIWSHALGRPAQLVRPPSAESLVKYEDYALSVGQPFSPPLELAAAVRRRSFGSPIDVSGYVDGIWMPSLDELRDAGVSSRS